VIQAVLPHFKRRGSGKIVNVASTGGRRGVDFAPAYCASKAGVISLTQSLAAALGKYGINVNAVCPGAIETEMREEIRRLGANLSFGSTSGSAVYSLPDPLTVEDIGFAVKFLASDYARGITGQSLNVDRGFHAN
jgi:ketoreductase